MLSGTGRGSKSWWYIASDFYKVLIFLGHAGVSVWLLILISDTETYCEEGSVIKHYVTEYVHNLANDPISSKGQWRPNNTWPVLSPNMPVDAAFLTPPNMNPILNVQRCMTSGKAFNTAEGMDEIQHIMEHRPKYTACALSGQFSAVEVLDDSRYTPVLGSKNAILFLMLLFEWISASFALFYLDIFGRNNDYYWARFVTLACALAWNLTLFIMTFYMASTNRWFIPTNNLIIGGVVLMWAVITHILYGIPTGKPMDDARPGGYQEIGNEEGGEEAENGAAIYNPAPYSTGSDVRQRKLPGQVVVSSIMKLPNSEPANLSVHWTDDALETEKIETLRSKMAATELRYIEYAITAPILMMGIQSTVVLNSPVWPLQVAYMGILLTNLYGIPLHQAVIFMVRIRNAFKDDGVADSISWITNSIMWTAIIMLIASWMAYTSAWLVFFQSVIVFFNSYPSGVAIAIVALPVFYSLFGVAASWYYIRWIVWYTDPEFKIKDLESDMMYLNFIFDTLSITVKILLVGVVVASDQFGPTAGCST